MEEVTVRVPASTSNLGPGFVCLGVALRLYNNVILSRVGVSSAHPMIQAAATAFFGRAKIKPIAFSCDITGNVPISRGLGSSMTIRLGVIAGLNHLTDHPLQKAEVFELCSKLEGHPDNAAPAVYGGFNVVRNGERQSFTVSPKLRFVLLIPNFEIATSRARRVLPARVNRLHAVENCRNACAITAAFASRDYNKLRGAFVDRLHQPFRKKMIPFLDKVIKAAESAGALGAFLSGSGSTICAIASESTNEISRAMISAAKSPQSKVVITSADNHGFRILRLGRSDGLVRRV